MAMVRRFVKRNGLSVRKTIEIKRGRQICTEDELKSWFELTQVFFSSSPDLMSATQDPSRLFNMVKIKYLIITTNVLHFFYKIIKGVT